MYFETSSPVRKGHQAWLSSPLYPKSYSGSFCFHFWYHSLGEGCEYIYNASSLPDDPVLELSKVNAYVDNKIHVAQNQWEQSL